MILLDTNVVSEAMKPEPHPSVRDWLDSQAAETQTRDASAAGGSLKPLHLRGLHLVDPRSTLWTRLWSF